MAHRPKRIKADFGTRVDVEPGKPGKFSDMPRSEFYHKPPGKLKRLGRKIGGLFKHKGRKGGSKSS